MSRLVGFCAANKGYGSGRLSPAAKPQNYRRNATEQQRTNKDGMNDQMASRMFPTIITVLRPEYSGVPEDGDQPEEPQSNWEPFVPIGAEQSIKCPGNTAGQPSCCHSQRNQGSKEDLVAPTIRR